MNKWLMNKHLVAFFCLFCIDSPALSAQNSDKCQDRENQEFNIPALGNLRFNQQAMIGRIKKALDMSLEKKGEADDLLTSAGLKLPDFVNISPCEKQCNSIYRYDHNSIKFTLYSSDDKNWFTRFPEPDRRLSGPTFIHEYAHAAFWESLVDLAIPWPALREKAEKFYCKQQEVSSAEQLTKLREEMDEALFITPKSKKLPLYSIHQIVVPYTEFYSDLVAALAYDNPSIMYVPINAYTEPDIEANNRDFSRMPIARSGDLTQHEILMETRHELWKLAWQEKLTRESKIRILRTVFDVFKEDIENRWANGRGSEDRITLNDRLISKLRSSLESQ